MKRYGLLGYPLKHTMSPPIHKRLFELDGLDGTNYELKEYSSEELPCRIDDLMALDGFNVTIPHKVEIIKYLDELGDSAKRYDSVNCVVKRAVSTLDTTPTATVSCAPLKRQAQGFTAGYCR